VSKRVELLAGERIKGESKKAIIACNDYLRMGAGRSLAKLIQKYTKSTPDSAPTTNLRIAKRWSTNYDWQARADAYDAQLEVEKNARRKEIMEAGLALDYERVSKLVELAEFLEEQITYEPGESANNDEEIEPVELTDEEFETQQRREHGDPMLQRPHVWLRDYKQIGSGEFAEKVDIYRFNAALVSEYRAALDDIAKEVGGRKQKVDMEHSGTVDVTGDDLVEARRAAQEFEQELLSEE
jgi:hypothetical protein